jgi:hypothetical protein
VKGSTIESRFRTFASLWRRAPTWRLIGLVAALLTALCVLFPARISAPIPAYSNVAAVSPASYTPQPEAAITPKTFPEPAPIQTAASASTTKPPHVQTANLSLATADTHALAPDKLNDALAGQRISGSLRVDGFDVPLPPGDWLRLASMHGHTQTASGEVLVLGRVKNRRLMGLVRITAARSTLNPAKGFPALPGCDRQNTHNNVLVNEAVEPFGHQACWLIDHSFLAPLQAWADQAHKLPPELRAAAGDLAAKGVSYPQDTISVRFIRAELWGALEVRYDFNPEEDHITSSDIATYADSDWDPANITRYPDKIAYVDKLKHWANDFWPRFKAAFDAGNLASSH